jgi:hypothetical protein
LSIISGIFAAAAWVTVISPILVLIMWGVRLVILLDHDTIGLAVILAGTALLLAFYAIMLWWRTQWQSSRMYCRHHCADTQFVIITVYRLIVSLGLYVNLS